jgi:Spy/CpxP family protein refolding chaperone
MKVAIGRAVFLLVLLCLGLVEFSTVANARPPGPSTRGGEPLEHLVETLGLDDATLTKVYKIIDDARAHKRELRRKLHEAHRHMRNLLEQDTPDEAAVMAQAETIGTLRTEMDKQRLQTMLQVRTLLTAEQRTKLLEALRSRLRPERPGPLSPSKEP